MAFTEKTPEFGPNTALLPGLNNMLDDDDKWKHDKNAGGYAISNLGVLTFGVGGYVSGDLQYTGAIRSTGNGSDPGAGVGLWLKNDAPSGYPTSLAGYSIQLLTGANSARVPRVTIDNGGNVGIGTASPVTALAVASATTPTITIQDTDVNGSGEYWYIQNSSGTLNLGQTTSGDGSYAGWTDRLTILNTGKVGIGTASPTAKLQVVGLASYANNGAAVAAGLTAGALYIVTGTNPAQVAIVT